MRYIIPQMLFDVKLKTLLYSVCNTSCFGAPDLLLSGARTQTFSLQDNAVVRPKSKQQASSAHI